MEKIVTMLRLTANTGIFYGGSFLTIDNDSNYMRSCSAYHRQTGSMIIFTRETGYHSQGWWKHPDYERCYHLSLSFRDPITQEPRPFDKKLAAEWIKSFLGNDHTLTWCEPPCYAEGKSVGVHHYRLFCDPEWQAIKPRGEVYNTCFTEKGWKSFSDLHYKPEREDPE